MLIRGGQEPCTESRSATEVSSCPAETRTWARAADDTCRARTPCSEGTPVRLRIVATTTGLLASAVLTMASPTAAVPSQAQVAATAVVARGTTYRPIRPAH